ncbi:MAG: TIGR02678 family protein [Peptostreptococcaceae bacterium]
MRLVDLLENYIIFKERDRDLYYDIKDNVENYKIFIRENLSYDLIIKEDFIKLEKIPSHPQPFMGIKDFDDNKEYIFFILLLMFLEDKNKEEQFILSNITEYIQHNYIYEKIDWTSFKNRKSLIKVIKLGIEVGIIKKNDGNEDDFSKSETVEVLYETTGISRYIMRNFNIDLEDINGYQDILESSNKYIDKTARRRNSVYRNLLLSPIVYNEGVDDEDYDYIKKFKGSIISTFEKNLDWDIHIHKNGAMVALKNSNEVRDTFPSKKGESSAILIINNKLNELIISGKFKIESNDTIILEYEEFKNMLIDIRKENGHGFVKDLRDNSDNVYVEKIKKYMMDFSMIKEETNKIIIMPLVSKVVGEYPSDYKGVQNEG